MVPRRAERRIHRSDRRRDHRAGGLGFLRAAARQLKKSPRRMTEYCAVMPTRLALRRGFTAEQAAGRSGIRFHEQHRQISFPRIRSSRIRTVRRKSAHTVGSLAREAHARAGGLCGCQKLYGCQKKKRTPRAVSYQHIPNRRRSTDPARQPAPRPPTNQEKCANQSQVTRRSDMLVRDRPASCYQ
jgi:hypothetical protein